MPDAEPTHPHEDAARSLPAAGKSMAFDDLYELDAGSADELKWKKLEVAAGPPARSKHAAVAVGAWAAALGLAAVQAPPVDAP
jgi:hypothetical protein